MICSCFPKDVTRNNGTSDLLTPATSFDVSGDKIVVKRITQVTDAINLFGGIVLLIMTCFSERMIQFEKIYWRKSRRPKGCVFEPFMRKAHHSCGDDSVQRPMKGGETVIEEVKHRDAQVC